jgi:hypothetical protein
MIANYQPLEVTDFSGGRTDNYVSGPINRYKTADNLVILKQGGVGKLITRNGSEIYNVTYPQVNSANERLGAIRNFRTTTADKVLVFSNRKLYYMATGWTELVGPVTSNKVFPAGTTVDNVVSYSEWNDHIFITNDAFAPVSKVYNDGSANLQLRTAGLPRLASSPTVTRGAAGTGDYVYRFVYKFTYTVNTVTHVDRGDYTEVELANSAHPDVTPVAITAIPVLANGATYNWDTANIKIEIYRSTDDGFTFYYVNEVTNGTTIYNDNTSDTTLQTHELLYTEGGVVTNDPVPLAKLVHVVGDTGYYAHIKDGSQIFSNRLMQSVPGDIDGVPSDFFVDVQDEIVGLSSTRGLPVLICRNSVYRIDGQFDFLGGGFMVAQRISDTSTCVSSQSVVQTIDGVFWAGEDSYFFTDGYQVIKLCDDWVETYRLRVITAAQKRRIQGKYDKDNRRIWWTTQEDSGGSSECNSCDVLHLDWGIKKDASFTSVSGQAEFAPTAIEFIGEDMLRGDRYGYLLVHSPDLVTDPKIAQAIAPASWSANTILWTFESCASNFGSSFMRKFSNLMTVTCRNRSNLSLQITSINDDGKKVEDLKQIRFRGNVVWGEETAVWGDADAIWGFTGLIEQQRRFPSKSLRFSYKQISFTNAFVVIVSSDQMGTVSVNGAANTATLTDAVTQDWPSDPIDYSIAFETDNYSAEYPITARTADTITFADTVGTAPTGSDIEFVIRGYPKGEVFSLLSYMIPFVNMGQTQGYFQPGQTGEVGT